METYQETVEQSLPLRSYAVLVKDGYVRDAQMSLLGYYVEDIFADVLVVTNDNGEKQEAEPFMEKNGDGTFEDDVCDFFGPVLLGIYHYPSSLTEEQIIKTIAEAKQIPPRYLSVLPLDKSISVAEWNDKTTQLYHS